MHGENQRFAVGVAAVAARVLFVAKLVQQCIGLQGAKAHNAAVVGVVPRYHGRDHLLRPDGLAFADHADLLVHVIAQDNGPAQCDFLGCVAANDGVAQIEKLVDDVGLDGTVHLHAFVAQDGQQAVFAV